MSFVGKNIDKALDRTRARTSTARAVLIVLVRHANKDLIAYPTQKLMARRLGISTRQVRTYLRELEALGEIETVEKGANRPTKYRLNILSDDVVERKHTSTPKAQMDRKSTTAPENGWTGSTASLGRKPTSYEVIEEDTARHSGVFEIVEDGSFAEKKGKTNPAFSPAQEPTAPSRDQAGMLGDRARDEDSDLEAFVIELHKKFPGGRK